MIKNPLVKISVLFSVFLTILFFTVSSKEAGKQIGPFSYNVVFTDSMQSVYPKGSLITSQALKTNEPLKAGLDNGTDIVFTKEDGTSVVHRIIEIIENYKGGGQRAVFNRKLYQNKKNGLDLTNTFIYTIIGIVQCICFVLV